ncbi:SDR family oxidoreductase [Shewanella youngdeokensis]|uniref:SDR family oxidoreductase n=1 Tax=Shewanella youngdeokensis TaxID=2999068 RepID=A0ABZ0JW25_9GAMM|nr:SDR family oxidoreductase [Shewanella sp. DAU334]
MTTRKTILITGASSGLGRGMALEFAKMGRDLALCARRVDRLEALKIELEAINPSIRVSVKALDVTCHQQVFDVFEQFKQQLGSIDRIILNAGMGKGAAIGTGHFEANKQTAETNFIGLLAQAEAAMAIFRAQNSGHLVTMSSVSAVRGFRRALTVYAATKAAVTSLTEGIRIDVMHTPMRVSCIHPGFIRSEINDHVEKVPFIVDTDVGCRAIVKAIEAEKANSFVPTWPWAVLHWVLRVMPQAWIRKMS